MSKASFFMKKSNGGNLSSLNFGGTEEKKEKEEIKEEGSLMNIEKTPENKNDNLEKSDINDDKNDDISSKASSVRSIEEKFAEDQEEKNILSIQLENWLCSGLFVMNFSLFFK